MKPYKNFVIALICNSLMIFDYSVCMNAKMTRYCMLTSIYICSKSIHCMNSTYIMFSTAPNFRHTQHLNFKNICYQSVTMHSCLAQKTVKALRDP